MSTFPPDQALALQLAPPTYRPALTALLALDGRLAQILRAAKSPMTAQLKLTWWRDALARLDDDPVAGEPILQAIATDVVATGVRGVALAEIAEGWMALLAEDFATAAVLDEYAALRGGGLFSAAARAFGGVADDQVVEAGKLWALADLAGHVSGLEVVNTVRIPMVLALKAAFVRRWSRCFRPIGTLSLLCMFELDHGSRLSNLVRLTRFRLIGR